MFFWKTKSWIGIIARQFGTPLEVLKAIEHACTLMMMMMMMMNGWKVDVPKSGDDMIFIAFHYGHWGGGGDNPDFNLIQIALVLAHHHA
jgi:hypothetical protein